MATIHVKQPAPPELFCLHSTRASHRVRTYAEKSGIRSSTPWHLNLSDTGLCACIRINSLRYWLFIVFHRQLQINRFNQRRCCVSFFILIFFFFFHFCPVDVHTESTSIYDCMHICFLLIFLWSVHWLDAHRYADFDSFRMQGSSNHNCQLNGMTLRLNYLAKFVF